MCFLHFCLWLYFIIQGVKDVRKMIEKYIETDSTFYKRLLAIAVPVILQSLITTGINLADNIMLGQLTETALSASTQANHFIMLFTFAIMGISMGTSVLSSRYWGAKDMTALKKVITIALRCGLALGLVFTLADIFLPQKIMGLYFRADAVQEMEAGVAYLQWSTACFFPMAVSFILTNILRSINLSTVPLLASVCAFGVNIGANYVLIFGKLGFSEMGVAGAALGTVIARIVETGIILICFLENKQIRYSLKDLLLPCRDFVIDFLRISVPVMLSDCLLGLGENVLAAIMGQIGSTFVSANSITAMVRSISTIFISGLSFSSCFLTGQTLGEGNLKMAKKQGDTYLLLGAAVGVMAAVIIQLISGLVIDVYKITTETKEVVRQLMNALCIIVIFRSTNSILTKGVLRGGGDTRFLLAADMSAMWLVAVPLGVLGGLVFRLPAFYTYLFLYSDQIIKVVWCVFRLHSGRWIKKISTNSSVGAASGESLV